MSVLWTFRYFVTALWLIRCNCVDIIVFVIFEVGFGSFADHVVVRKHLLSSEDGRKE